MKGIEVKNSKRYILRLEKDERVAPTIVRFCKERGIMNATFRGIGAVNNAKVGYYDLEKRTYGTLEYVDDMEVASMIGNVSNVDGEPFIHAHVVLSDVRPGAENVCIGGHLFEAIVAVTLEVDLESFEGEITRTMDDAIGLKVLNCPSV